MDKTVLPSETVIVEMGTEYTGNKWFATAPSKLLLAANANITAGNPDKEIRGNIFCLFMAVGIKYKVPFSEEVTPSLPIFLSSVLPQRNPKVNAYIICQRQRTANSALMYAFYSSPLIPCVQDMGY